MTAHSNSLSSHGPMPARRKAIIATAGTLLLGGVSMMGMGSMSASRTLRPSDEPIQRAYFGMHIHRADTSTPWPGARFGSWRLWDAYVAWPNLEPKRGEWDFKRLDKYVAMAGLTGVDLLLPLGLSPGWASARPDEPSAYQPGNAAEPKNLNDWRNYVRTVAERYKGRIRHYELWNEPNLRNFYSGSVEAMLTLAREAYAILKQVDPSNQMAAPATTEGGKHLVWLDRYLALGGGNYLDVLSHHFYSPHEPPEAMLAVMDDVRAIMMRHGLSHKPVWNTETGWWLDNAAASSTFTSWKKLKSDEAVAYVARALILGWAAGLERYYWYSWDHGNMGLIEPRDKTLKPAGVAYATVLRWLEGAVMTDCSSSEGFWTCTLKRPGATSARIVWQVTQGVTPWKVPANWSASEVETLEGARQRLSSAAAIIELGQKPVLVL